MTAIPPRDEASRELIENATKGDDRAVESLLQQHLPGLRAFVRLQASPMIRAQESSSDIVQSVCREILQHVDRYQYQGEANFKHWLFTTAMRKLTHRRDYYRAEKRDIARNATPPKPEFSGAEGLLEYYSSFTTPSQHAMAREELARVEKAFDELPEHYREVILMARVVGLSRSEIAEKTGRTEGAVGTLLYRAMAELSGLLT